MAVKRKKRPRDPIELAKLIGDIAIGQVQESQEDSPKVARARKGGKIGGRARATKLTPKQRTEIARLAAEARWKVRR